MFSPPNDPAAVSILREVIAHPDENTHRYAYADYLRERNRGDDALWADFILDGLYLSEGVEDEKVRTAGKAALKVLSDKVVYKTQRFVYYPVPRELTEDASTVGISWAGGWGLWDRGFMSHLNLDDCLEWDEIAKVAYWNPGGSLPCPPTAQPIRTVHFTNYVSVTPAVSREQHLRYPGIQFAYLPKRLR